MLRPGRNMTYIKAKETEIVPTLEVVEEPEPEMEVSTVDEYEPSYEDMCAGLEAMNCVDSAKLIADIEDEDFLRYLDDSSDKACVRNAADETLEEMAHLAD